MIRRFCDVCGDECTTPTQLHFKWGGVTVELLRAVNGRWNGGDVCLVCLLEVIDRGVLLEKNTEATIETARLTGRLSGTPSRGGA